MRRCPLLPKADIPALLKLRSLENVFDAVSQRCGDGVARHFNHLRTLRPLARDAIRKHICFAPMFRAGFLRIPEQFFDSLSV
jgi:hypothetical protein